MSGKKIKTRLLALFLCMVMVVTVLPVSNEQAKAASNEEITQKLTELSKSMNGKYWNAGLDVSNSNDFGTTNAPCAAGKCTSNHWRNLSWQCAGFARWLGKYMFGSDPNTAWKKYTNFSQAVLEPGDIIVTNEPHSGMVWKIEGDMIYVAECWGGSGCKLNWGCWNGSRSKAQKSYISGRLRHWYKHPGGSLAAPADSPSSISISGAVSYPSGNLSLGQRYTLRGTITSAYVLTSVTGTIYNAGGAAVQQKSVNPNATTYSLEGGAIDYAMRFNDLSPGSYTLAVSATDGKGYSKNVIEGGFTVGTIASPAITSSDIAGGVKIQMSAPEGTIHYTLDGSEPSASSPVYTGEFPLHGSTVIKAFAEKDGSSSNVITQNVTVAQLAAPEIITAMEEDSIAVSIRSDSGANIYYTTDGTEPNESSERYANPLYFKTTKKIKAIAVKNGAINSGVSEKDIKAEVPQTPAVTLGCENKIAVGEAAKAVWDRQEYATSYRVRLLKNGKTVEEKTIQGCAYAFTLSEAGEYQMAVSSLNFMGNSAEGNPVTVTAMAPLTVTFADSDGKTISTQQVRYGYAAELPENPSKRGYEFKKWDNQAVYAAIKENLIVKAEYAKRKYIVKFLDEKGEVYAPQQEVPFDESVVLPKEPTIDKIGYAFMGWRCISSDESSALDYEHVDANMTLQAVFDWGNKDLPVVSQITRALQADSNSYKISVSLTNWPSSKTYCKLLVSLKTSNGKMVKTITKDVALEAGETKSVEDIELISDKVATQAEVNVVGLEDQKTAGAYAKAASAKTTSYANAVWSDWSTDAPPSGTVQETKTMYRYRDRMYTSSSSSRLDGWEQCGSTMTEGDWSDTYETTSNPGESMLQRIVGTSTVYNYYHYCCNKYGGINNVDSIPYGSGAHYFHTLTTDAPLRAFNMADKGGQQCYGGKGVASGCSKNFYAWFSNGSTTTYYYQTRNMNWTYQFRQWGEWSSYTEQRPDASDDRETEETAFYRYQIPMETPQDKEDSIGTVYEEEGNLSAVSLDLSGRCANVLVYRSTNSDPTENQLEYVGQTVIGKDNAYSFSFIPKETPDEAKNNYIVALAIEGQTSLYNIDVIYAKNVRYKVSFYGRDGNMISSCEVKAGESANVPDVPEVPGYTFLGWDKDTTNILSDKSVTARYKENEYSIVYVDFENSTADILQLTHGTSLPSPAAKSVEGMTFLGWDKILDGTDTADCNMILTARYEKKKYKVVFADDKDKVISAQEVVYGGTAEPPAGAFADNAAFLGWSADQSWWKVKNDMIVKPIFGYAKTADTPLYNIEDAYQGGILTISQTEGQDVYYSIEWEDESPEGEMEDPVEETGARLGQAEEEPAWKIYEKEIFLERSAAIHFYAAGSQMNASNTVDIVYERDNTKNPYKKTAKLQFGDVSAQGGKTVLVPITLLENPGILELKCSVSYDTSVFSGAEYKEAGTDGAGGSMSCQADSGNGKMDILWVNSDAGKQTGSLGALALQLKEQAADGVYPLTIQCVQEETYDGNWMDVNLELSGGTIQIGKGSSQPVTPEEPGQTPSETYTCQLNNDNQTITITKCVSSSASITIPSAIDGYAVTGIGSRAFENMAALVSAALPPSLKMVEHHAFAGCTALKNLSVPKDLTVIDENAFFNTGISEISYAGTKEDWKNITIKPDGNDALLKAMVTGADGVKFSANKNAWASAGQDPGYTVKKPSVAKAGFFYAIAGRKKLSLSWAGVPKAAGYQLQVSTSKSFKGAKTISISKSKRSYASKNLKAKKKYYARIRAWKSYKDEMGRAQKAYGAWAVTSEKTM